MDIGVDRFSTQERVCFTLIHLLVYALDKYRCSPVFITSQRLREVTESACRQAFVAGETSVPY